MRKCPTAHSAASETSKLPSVRINPDFPHAFHMSFSNSIQQKQSTVVSPNPPNAASLALEGQILKLIMWKIPATALTRFRCSKLCDWLKAVVSFVNVRDSCGAQEGDECCLSCFVALFYFQDTYLQYLFCPLAFICRQLRSAHTLGWKQKRRKKRKCVPSLYSFQALLLILLRYLLAGLGLFFLGLVIGWFTHNPPAVKPPAPPSDSSDLLEELLKGITADKIDALQK